MPQVPITELKPTDLKDVLSDWGEPEYRAQQILDWVYRKPVADFQSMHNLPPRLRAKLEEDFTYQSLGPIEEVQSRAGDAVKVAFRLLDGKVIETVLMYYKKRRTVCVSSQVGCAFGCPLCATGASGFERNLTSAEIIDQVLYFSRRLKAEERELSNVVFMGMGEPLVNFDQVWQAIERITAPRLVNLGARHITISTSGIAPGIKKLAKKKQQVGLAVSLHAPNDRLRDDLVPPNRMYPLENLLSACRDYTGATNRRVSFEYAIIRGVNDSPQMAVELADLLRGMNCFVNIIPVNPADHTDFKPPPKPRIQYFSEILARHHVANMVRLRRGGEIGAGCGQLKARLGELL
ncbi:MAG: 23S rRNA (adenine(2503)-C(2))-methyltransferase RlmN [Dehalococcoidia bacterium]